MIMQMNLLNHAMKLIKKFNKKLATPTALPSSTDLLKAKMTMTASS